MPEQACFNNNCFVPSFHRTAIELRVYRPYFTSAMFMSLTHLVSLLVSLFLRIFLCFLADCILYLIPYSSSVECVSLSIWNNHLELSKLLFLVYMQITLVCMRLLAIRLALSMPQFNPAFQLNCPLERVSHRKKIKRHCCCIHFVKKTEAVVIQV
jgi:hypothetical protein